MVQLQSCQQLQIKKLKKSEKYNATLGKTNIFRWRETSLEYGSLHFQNFYEVS